MRIWDSRNQREQGQRMYNGNTREQGYLYDHQETALITTMLLTIKRGAHDSNTPVICKRHLISFEKHQTNYATAKK